MKRFLSLVLCVAMIATAIFSVSAVSAAEVANGTCGSNLTWTLDSEGTLTIDGTGLMYDYSNKDKENADGTVTDLSAPWVIYAADIKKVVIGENVNYIGEYAFEACTALESIVLSAGSYAPYIPVENFELNTPYKLMTYNLNAPIYMYTVSGALKATPCPDVARDIYVETATTLDGEPAYRLYYYYNGVKSYFYHDKPKDATGFKYTETVPLYNETTDAETGEVVQGDEISTVWTYDEVNKAWSSPASNNRFLGSDNTSTREDIRCYAQGNITQAKYTIARLAVKDSAAADIPGTTSVGKNAFLDCAALTNIYCRTSEEAWAKVSAQAGNDVLAAETTTITYNYSDGSTTAPEAITVVSGSKYTVDEAKGMICVKVASARGESYATFVSNIATDGDFYQVLDKNGAPAASGNMTNSHSVQLLDANGAVVKTYKVIIVGDANGDGRIAGADTSKIKLWVKDNVKTTNEVAIADVDGNGRLQGKDVSAHKAAVKKGGF